jgi:hypothetical protein
MRMSLLSTHGKRARVLRLALLSCCSTLLCAAPCTSDAKDILYPFDASRGELTTGQAKWWKQQLQTFLAQDAGSR